MITITCASGSGSRSPQNLDYPGIFPSPGKRLRARSAADLQPAGVFDRSGAELAPDVGDVLTLDRSRTDDPLAGVTVPVSAARNPAEDRPSHLQEVHAELVAGLPVPDNRGGIHHSMPALHTSADYAAYIRARTAMWKASRKK